jgi:hypothetical protein
VVERKNVNSEDHEKIVRARWSSVKLDSPPQLGQSVVKEWASSNMMKTSTNVDFLEGS